MGPQSFAHGAPRPWFGQPAALARFVGDLISDELAQLRPGGAPPPDRPWPPGLSLDEQGLGLDSLERMAIASAVNEALHLHESGIEDLLLAKRQFGQWLEVANDGLAIFDATLTFRTSGSSGPAKPCAHALADLQQEVEHLATLFPETLRVLSAVPAHHIYGFLFTVLLPQRLACPDVIDIRQMTPQSLASNLRAGDVVVSHPAHWSVFARHTRRVPAGVRGVTSTAPCPDPLAQTLVDVGLESLTQVYGSTETAGVGTRTGAGAPFVLMPFWSRQRDDFQELARTSRDGSTRTHVSQDQLEWLDDERFHVNGRRDGAVQVGGTNVFPTRVRQVLLQHPQVADAAVRLMAPDEGARLKAFVVPAPGCDVQTLQSSLWTWTTSRLTAPERPKAFSFGAQLPCNSLGKPSDWPVGSTALPTDG